jgi:hypothetical protein
MQLTALFLLALFPFIGIAVLVWKGPKHTAAKAYRQARQRTAALAEAAERESARLAEADARFAESQRRLTGEAPAALADQGAHQPTDQNV